MEIEWQLLTQARFIPVSVLLLLIVWISYTNPFIFFTHNYINRHYSSPSTSLAQRAHVFTLVLLHHWHGVDGKPSSRDDLKQLEVSCPTRRTGMNIEIVGWSFATISVNAESVHRTIPSLESKVLYDRASYSLGKCFDHGNEVSPLHRSLTHSYCVCCS